MADIKKKFGVRTFVVWAILTGLTAILVANAHLVYVAIASDPECVLATSDVQVTNKIYRPAKSAC